MADLERREGAAAAVAEALAAREQELLTVVHGQGSAAVELERKAAEVARREREVAQREAELKALWETAETSALERAEAAIAPRLAVVEEREHDLAVREATFGRAAGDAGAAQPVAAVPTTPVSRAEALAAAHRVAPPQRNLLILQSLADGAPRRVPRPRRRVGGVPPPPARLRRRSRRPARLVRAARRRRVRRPARAGRRG